MGKTITVTILPIDLEMISQIFVVFALNEMKSIFLLFFPFGRRWRWCPICAFQFSRNECILKENFWWWSSMWVFVIPFNLNWLLAPLQWMKWMRMSHNWVTSIFILWLKAVTYIFHWTLNIINSRCSIGIGFGLCHCIRVWWRFDPFTWLTVRCLRRKLMLKSFTYYLLLSHFRFMYQASREWAGIYFDEWILLQNVFRWHICTVLITYARSYNRDASKRILDCRWWIVVGKMKFKWKCFIEFSVAEVNFK